MPIMLEARRIDEEPNGNTFELQAWYPKSDGVSSALGQEWQRVDPDGKHIRPFDRDAVGKLKIAQNLTKSEETYTVQTQPISEGMLSDVYRGSRKNGQAVVLKKMKVLDDFSPSKELGVIEAHVQGNLTEPHILKILDAFYSPDEQNKQIFWQVLPDLEKDKYKDLYEWYISSSEELTNKEIVHIFEDLEKAVGYLTKKGVKHRDLKLQNIFYSRDMNHTLLADFGITNLSISDEMIAGTPKNLAPEEYYTKSNLDKKYPNMHLEQTTVYAFAVMIFELLTKGAYVPNELTDYTKIIDWILKHEFSRADLLAHQFSLTSRHITGEQLDMLIHVFETALRINPLLRYRTVREFLSALRDALGINSPISVSPRSSSDLT